MIKTIALALAVWTVALGAEAQTPQASPALPTTSTIRPGGDMLLIPGRELVVTWKAGAPPAQVSEGAAAAHGLPPIPHDPDNETWVAPIPTDKFKKAEPGQIAFSLWVEAGRGTTLAAVSGQAQPFFYMANLIMRREGRLIARPTTICAVQPGLVGLETWPEMVEAIQIVGIGLSPADMCYDHRAKAGYKMGEQPPSNTPPPASPASTSPTT